MNHCITKTLLALGCAGTLAATASALPTTYTQGDYLLGFREVGSSTSVVLDLGSITNYTAPQVFSINAGSILTAQYGSGWATNANVFFSLAATSSAGNTNYVTSPEYLTGVDAGPAKVWNRLTNTNSNIFQGKINNLGGEFSLNGEVESNTNDANAYANFMPGGTNDAGHASGGIAWGYFNPTSEANLGQGTSGVTLDTIQLVAGSGPGTNVGDFSLSGDGNTLTFTPFGTVPEPSSLAAMALGALALLGFLFKKARKSSAKKHLA